MQHDLKIEKQYLENLVSGKKRCEIRFNDRDYQVGDVLHFKEYFFDGNVIDRNFKVTHIHSGLGMADGFVVLSVKRV